MDRGCQGLGVGASVIAKRRSRLKLSNDRVKRMDSQSDKNEKVNSLDHPSDYILAKGEHTSE